MDEHIHSKPGTSNSLENNTPIRHALQEIAMEKRFSAELAMLKGFKLKPRPEAIENLLNEINQGTLEEHL